MKSTAETLCLGLLFREAAHVDRALSLGLKEEHFYEPLNAALWSSLAGEVRRHGIFDAAAVAAKTGEAGAVLHVANLLSDAPVAQNVEYYVTEVIEAYWSSKAARELARLSSMLLSRRPFETQARLEALQSLHTFIEGETRLEMTTPEPRELADDFAKETEAAIAEAKEGKQQGITTGLRCLDTMMFGWRPATFNVLGARTSCGKTTFACNFALSAAEAGKHIAFFTVEMRATRIQAKVISRMTGINSGKIVRGHLSETEIDQVAAANYKLAELGLRVNDKAGRTIEAVESESYRLRRRGKLDLLIIDYVQQLYWPSRRWQNRQVELTAITAQLQELGQRLGIPVLVLAQLNRQAEMLPPDQPPGKHHLKDSGSLEQDADVILLIHRPIFDDPVGKTSIVIAKNRDGALGDHDVDVDMSKNRVADWRPIWPS